MCERGGCEEIHSLGFWRFLEITNLTMPWHQAVGFLGGSDSRGPARNAGDPGSIPGLGRSPGERHDNPLQYSDLENCMDRGAQQATVHGVAKS